ncbi:hypothetical protein [Laspinema olomoucense]|uniref:hypothetical protein n=1 Tax=Laspinema olomoucense TaxID=3231600 RepID=UPI0021BB6D5A|nr:hypothetical protein [Laspinema sp. D3a]MCT7987123.1 hypothetical protein [Laspinema sp. D3a]
MLSNWFEFILLTLFNATFCVLLPRVITLNWSQIFSQLKGQTKRLPHITGEDVSNPGLVSSLKTPSLHNQVQ